MYRYRFDYTNDNDSAVFCEMIEEALEKARRVRKKLTKIVKDGYGDASYLLPEAMRDIEEIYVKLIEYTTLAKCKDDAILCDDDIALNNAKEGCKTALKNLAFIAENYHDCGDLESLIDTENDMFCKYVLGTLCKMKSECYKCREKMLEVRYNPYKAVHCTGKYTDALDICEMLDEAYTKASCTKEILFDMLAKYELDDDYGLSYDINVVLENNLRVLVNDTHLIYSQMPIMDSLCSKPIMEARLMEANRLAAALRRLLKRYEYEDACNRLYFLSIYYELAEQITGLLGQVKSGFGCTICLGGNY